MDDFEFSIITPLGLADAQIVGLDTMIAVVPDVYIVDGVINVTGLERLLRDQSEQAARNLGEYLHHADFVLTTDPVTVEKKGAVHDCDVCREGVLRALQHLRENPTVDLAVGTLYWAQHQ